MNSIPTRPVLSFSFLFPEAYLNLVVFTLRCVCCSLEQEAWAGICGFPRAHSKRSVLRSHAGCPLLAMCVGKMEVKPWVPSLCLGPSWRERTGAAHQVLPLVAKIGRVFQQDKVITIANSASVSAVRSFPPALAWRPTSSWPYLLVPPWGKDLV